MDFLDPDKKRARGIKLFLGYLLVAIAIGLGAIVLLLRSYGYDLDRKTGQVIQNGLIYVSSQPVSANLSLNGEIKGATNARLTVPAGQYKVTLSQKGYRDWRRTFTLEGAGIERLVYPLLFPSELKPKDQKVYDAVPVLATNSPDRRWILVQQPGQLEAFDLFDANNPNDPVKTVRLPAGLLNSAAPNRSLSLVEWSSDNRRVLLKHSFEGGSEFVMVDRQEPASSFNVNKTFSLDPAAVALRDKKFDHFYLHMPDGSLRRGEFKSKEVTPLIDQVLAFKSYGSNTVLYVTSKDAAAGKVRLQLRDGDQTYTMRTLPVAPTYLLDLAQFDGAWYMVASAQAEGRVYIYKDPLETLKEPNHTALVPVSILKLNQPQFLSFSQNARFVATQNGSQIGVYDIETDKRYYYTLPFPLDAAQKAVWMDGHRLTLTHGGQVVVWDFDGINQQTLVASDPGHKAFFDRDYDRLYTIGPSTGTPGKAALTLTDLVVK